MKLWPFKRAAKRAHPASGDPVMIALFGGRDGEVTTDNATRCSAVYACVKVISETVASLPLFLYRRVEKNGRVGKEKALDHPLYEILHSAPNPEMTSFQWREAGTSHMAIKGDHFAEIDFDGAGRIRGVWPLPPSRIKVRRRNDVSPLEYYFIGNDGRERQFAPGTILHIPYGTTNGVTGQSPIEMVKQAVELSVNTEAFGNTFFTNGATVSGVLQHPGKLSQEAHDRLVGSLKERHEGVKKAHRLLVTEEGMTYQAMGLAPEHAQFLETRKFQVEEICRIFRVPPHLIQNLERATFGNIEHQSIDFVVHTIRPWLVRWEQALTRTLLSPEEQREYFVEFSVDGLLRGDIASRYAAYAIGRNWGWLSANDVRALENMDPIPGGDTYLSPANMYDASKMPAPPADSDAGRAWRLLMDRIPTNGTLCHAEE